MRIGCLFGSFDPPHLAHVAIGEHMLRARDLDQVWFVVTPSNPLKQDRQLSPENHRLAMVRLALMGHDALMASGVEMHLPRPNYTADTLRFMRQRWPQDTFSLIIGSDNLAILHRWKDPEEILAHHRILVHPRPGSVAISDMPELARHPSIDFVEDAPLMPISSTEIRALIKTWAPLTRYLDPAVISYIRQHRLYQ